MTLQCPGCWSGLSCARCSRASAKSPRRHWASTIFPPSQGGSVTQASLSPQRAFNQWAFQATPAFRCLCSSRGLRRLSTSVLPVSTGRQCNGSARATLMSSTSSTPSWTGNGSTPTHSHPSSTMGSKKEPSRRLYYSSLPSERWRSRLLKFRYLRTNNAHRGSRGGLLIGRLASDTLTKQENEWDSHLARSAWRIFRCLHWRLCTTRAADRPW